MRSSLYGGLCLAVLAVGLVAAGCGGGDDALTKSEFLKQGNTICKKGNDQINKDAKQTFGNKQPSQAQVNSFTTETLIPVVQREIDGVRDLNPPSEDKDQVTAIFDEAQAVLDKVKKDPAALILVKPDPFTKANQLAKDYGLKECAAS
ncbi:MAG: hypothetical protein AABM43_06505 [Actinomycetota bacterium]